MTPARRMLFLLASSREGGNTEMLARRAAASLPPTVHQSWLRLSDLPLASFEDIRHADRAYAAATGNAEQLLSETLAATELVFVTPLYWYSVPATLKLYLDHWSGWMRSPGVDFRSQMAGKSAWAISSYSSDDPAFADPMFAMLRLSAEYMGMHWGGQLLGKGNRPGDISLDTTALAQADRLFVGGDPSRHFQSQSA